MIIAIDPGSATPPYAQIQEQIATMIGNRVLADGDRLPTIRHLARDLGVAVNTVARAYRELEADALVATRGRHGTFVLTGRATAADPSELADMSRTFAREASQRGLGVDDALDAIRAAFLSIDDRPSTP